MNKTEHLDSRYPLNHIATVRTGMVEGEGHEYNASIVRWNGKIVMAFRLQDIGMQGVSRIAIIELDDAYRPIAGTGSVIPLEPAGGAMMFEDPRLFVCNGRLWMSYSAAYHLTTCAIGCALLGDDYGVERCVFVPYGNNARNEALLKSGGAPIGDYALRKAEDLFFEKNWQFFEYEGRMHAVYSIAKHMVIDTGLDAGSQQGIAPDAAAIKTYASPSSIGWRYGEPRGSTPPIRIGDAYWTFFHSHLRIWNKKIYYVGAYSFDAHPPFAMRSMTKKPLARASDAIFKNGILPIGLSAIFPCGAIYDADTGIWNISAGHNDHEISIYEISHKDLIACMSPISELIDGPNRFWRLHIWFNKKVFDLLVDIDIILTRIFRSSND